MRPFTPQYLRQINTSFRQTSLPKTLPRITTRTMSDRGELKIENTNVNTSSGVTLDKDQQILVGSVLDLFAGRPSLAKLSLWKDDAVFRDPITTAQGRKEYEPQWYINPPTYPHPPFILTTLAGTASNPPSRKSSASATKSLAPATPSP